MRINYTMMGMGLTGGVRVLFEVANRLVDRGHDVTFTYVGDPDAHKWFPLKAKLNYVDHKWMVKVHQNLQKRAPASATYPFRELLLLAKGTPDCDINVATESITTYAVRWSGKGLPAIHQQHYDVIMQKDPFTKRAAEDTYRLPMHRIANSVWLQGTLKEKHGLEGLPLINPALQHEIFHPRGRETLPKPRIVSFCKHIEWKGFADARAAVKAVKEKRDVEWVVYGGEQPHDPDGVVDRWMRLPSDEDLAKLYSSADVVLCPSWYESFPLPPIEAMACAAPVVTTREGTEDYAEDGRNSLVVPGRDVAGMTAAMLRLLDDKELAESFRKAGPETAKRFTWERTTDQVEAYFSSLVGARRPSA